MYDAIPADQEALVQSLDPEMDKFLPMLQDYLTRMQMLKQLLFFLAQYLCWFSERRRSYRQQLIQDGQERCNNW